MKILHYTLGLPPNRSGGLTKYATDLMLSQKNIGDEVSLLYPGDYAFWKQSKMQIIKGKTYQSIFVFQIENPSVVPLLHGVREPENIYGYKPRLSVKLMELFYHEVQPDIMHIHTLMGLPLELIVFLKEKGVKIIFTSHDYYGLCMKVNFINQNGDICNSPNGLNCAVCNKNAPSSLFLRLRNSSYLLRHKARISSRSIIKSDVSITDTLDFPSNIESTKYGNLITHFIEMLKFVDCFHYNSSVSKEVYENYLTPKKSKIIPISHADILDFRTLKTFDKNHVKIGFIGSASDYKGLPMLKETLIKLQMENISNWSLQVWGGGIGLDTECMKISYAGKYSSDEIKMVFEGIDLLIVPSVWKETFSLITLEALSFGVPVLLTSNVGAKDIVKQYDASFVVEPTIGALYCKIKSILVSDFELAEYNNKINSKSFNFGFEKHIIEIKQLYNSVLD
jgi:glycosyltransferase involved in cell wall biosynthesis